MGKSLLGLIDMNVRIRNNYQPWLDHSSVQSMGTTFKERHLTK